MKEQDQINTTPPIQTAKVAEYLIDLYDRSGYVLDEKEAIDIASSADLKNELSRQYRVLGATPPPQKEIDSLYDSFLDKAEVEKKNLFGTTTSLLESSSVLEERDSSSALDQSVMEISLDEDPIGPEKIFSDALARVDMNVFSLDGKDASIILDKHLGFYGFTFTPSTKDRKVTITAPDGETRDFRLFTEAYRNFPGQTQEINTLAERRLEEMKSFLQSKSNSFKMDNMSAIMSVATPENIIDEITRVSAQYDDEATSEMNEVLSKFNKQYNINEYLDNGKLNLDKVSKGYQDARMRLMTKSESFDTTVAERLNDATEKFNITKNNIASVLSGVLSKTGAYSKIDINDPVSLNSLKKAGLSPADIPLDAIKVNGRARSFNYLTSNILHDFDKVQAIRDGKISIEIGDPKSAGLLAPLVQQARNEAETQKAFASKHAGNKLIRFTEEVGELGMNFMQSTALSLYEIGVNHAYIYYDSLKAIGLSEEDAKGIVYGATDVPVSLYGAFRPETLENIRQETLPKWDGDYLDANGFHEIITRGSQDLAGSLVHTGLFMIPGGQPLALANVATSTYARDRRNFESLRKDVEEKRKLGYVLSEEEMNILNMSDSKARMLSISKSASETALTYAFTGQFFKNYRKFAGVKPKIESLHGSISNFNRVYAKAVRNDFIGLVSRYAGVSSRAIATEVPEEELIAFTDYTSDILFGIKKYDGREARRLAGNTGISSLFTSVALGKAAALGTNARARKLAVDIVTANITLDQESSLIRDKSFADAEIKIREDEMRANGVDPSTDVYNTILRSKSLDLSDKINRIQEEKEKIASQMPGSEKLRFFELLESIQKTKEGMASAKDAGQQKAILEEIDQLRDKGKKILSKYPSELSYYFADEKTQDRFQSSAIRVLSEEAAARGEESTIMSNDQVVFDKAASLYNQYLKDKKADEISKYNAFQSVGSISIPDIAIDIDDDDRSKTLQDLMFFLENVNKTETTLDDLIVTDPEYVRLVRERDKTMSDMDQVILNDLDKIIEDPNSTPEEVEEAKKQRNELDKNYDLLEDMFKEQLAEIKGRALADKYKKSIERSDSKLEDMLRMNSVFSRFNLLDMVNIGSTLSDKEMSTIYQFKKDVQDGNRPKFGQIEAMLDGLEATNAIYAKSGGRIDLSTIVGEDGTLTEKGIATLNKAVADIYSKGIFGSGGFATKDVLARALFRDRNVGAPFIDLMNEAFRLSSEAEQVASAAYKDHLSAYKDDGGKNPNDIKNSYEMFVLSALKRESEIMTDDGKNSEFARTQTLILNQLDRFKKKSDSEPENKDVKLEYETLKEIVDRLGVAEAKNYAQVSSKAAKYNVNAVDRVAGIMPGERAFSRIRDFEKYSPYEYKIGSYVPIFMKKNGEAYSDFFGPSNSGQESIAASLKDVTRPERLPDDVDLNMGGFFDNVYNQYRGMEMDIRAKKTYETLDFMVNSPRFQDMFEGKAKGPLLDSFKGLKAAFEKDVRGSNPRVVAPGNLPKNYGNKLTTAIYSTAATVALARLTQNASQYYTAIAGSSSRIENWRARAYLGMKTAQFSTFTGGLYDGSAKKLSLKDSDMSMLRFKDAKLGNIYAKSRTGFRNSVLASLAVDANKKIPISYYTSLFKIDPSKEKNIVKYLGSTATVDRFLDFIIKSSEFNLNFFLGRGDRLAANATFEAAYLDNRISQGAEIGEDLNAWWAEENRNPNLEAIRHADEVVALTQRQTGQPSEAKVYSSDARPTVKNAMRIIFPFSKFVMNAKSDVVNNLNIILDPSVPQSQKQLAENAILGRGMEIMSYNFLKYSLGKLMVNGVISAFGFGSLGEEEDIEKYGGITKLIGETILPIVSKEDFDPMEMGLSEATSYEQYEAILKAQSGFTEVEGIADEFKTYARTFENKFTTEGDYGIIGPSVQDLITSMSPVPVPDVADDVLAMLFNQLYGEDVAMEFISNDLGKLKTAVGYLDFVSEKAGTAGLAFEQFSAVLRAKRMAFNLEINKFADFGIITEHLSAPTDAMREKLVGATQLLLAMRISALTVPVLPRADIDKMADKLERAIENNFATGKKDEKMHEIKGNFIFPFNGLEEEPIDNNAPE